MHKWIYGKVMELRHLRYFVAVATELHMGRAAQRLHISQPALSRRIQDLEADLGFQLLERHARGVSLTKSGQSYLIEIRRILGDLRNAEANAREFAGNQPEIIRLAHPMLHRAHDMALEHLLKRFVARYPRYTVNLQLLGTHDQQVALSEGSIDGGFVHLFGLCSPDFTSHCICTDAFSGARVGIGNAFAAANSIELRELTSEPLMIFRRARNPLGYSEIVGLLRKGQFTGNVVELAEFSEWNWKMLPRDRGWILGPWSERRDEDRATRHLPFTNMQIPFELNFIHRAGDRPRFVDDLLSIIEDPDPEMWMTMRPMEAGHSVN